MILTDTHTHLYLNDFDSDRTEAVQRAIDAGVKKMFLPNIDSSSIPVLLALEKQFPDNCFPLMGLHPCSVKENYHEELSTVEQWLKKKKFYAIGEIGLDFYWDKTTIQQQKYVFSKQIQWAKKYELPVVIHQRECFDEVFEMVKSECNTPQPLSRGEELKGIFHCFTGTVQEAEKIISLINFKLGIGGVITYRNSHLAETIRQIDLKHIVLETDSPYLTPVPYRGKRNESAYLIFVAKKIAEVKKIPVEEIAEITTKNAEEIFSPAQTFPIREGLK